MALLALVTLLAIDPVYAQEDALVVSTPIGEPIIEQAIEVEPSPAPLAAETSASLLEIDRAMLLEEQGEADRAISLRQAIYQKQMANIHTATDNQNALPDQIRQLVENAYNLGWFRIDQNDLLGARAIESKLETLLQPFDSQGPRREWALPLARWHWLRAGIFDQIGNQEVAQSSTARALQVTAERDTYLEDYAELSRLRLRILDYNRRTENDLEEYCELARQLNLESSGEFQRQIFSCRFRMALYLRDAGNYADAMNSLESLVNDLQDKINDRDYRRFSILIPKALSEQSYVASMLGQQENSVNLIVRAAESFSEILRESSFVQTYANEIKDTYLNFSNLNLYRSPRFSDRIIRGRETVRIFSDLANALDRTLLTYPNSASIAFVSADVRLRTANALVELGQPDEAQNWISSALALVEPHSVLNGNVEFTEDARSQCSLHAANVKIAFARRNAELARTAYNTAEERCGPWLRRFPWDVFTRDEVVGAAVQAGTLLSEARRFEDALPLLTFASDWGWSEASFELAQIYRDPDFSGFDLDTARRLHSLSLRQGAFNLSLPATSGNAQTRFSVTLRQYGNVERCPVQDEPLPEDLVCAGFLGIRDMTHWIKVARGYTVADDVVLALDTLANQTANNGSFAYAVRRLLAQGNSPATNDGNDNLIILENSQVISYAAGEFDLLGIRLSPTISRVSRSNCLGWILQFQPRSGFASLNMEYILSDIPSEPHNLSPEFQISEDGKVISTTRQISTEGGIDLYQPFCLSPGDPIGTYRFVIRQNGQMLANLSFEVVE